VIVPRLEISNLTFSYPNFNNKQESHVILKNISISIPNGGYSIGIVGPSGNFHTFKYFITDELHFFRLWEIYSLAGFIGYRVCDG
jgi:hypothetical protein